MVVDYKPADAGRLRALVVLTRYVVRDRGILFRFLAGGGHFIFQAEHTESGTLVLPRGTKQPGSEGGPYFHPAPRSRSGVMPSIPLYLHDVHTDNFT